METNSAYLLISNACDPGGYSTRCFHTTQPQNSQRTHARYPHAGLRTSVTQIGCYGCSSMADLKPMNFYAICQHIIYLKLRLRTSRVEQRISSWMHKFPALLYSTSTAASMHRVRVITTEKVDSLQHDYVWCLQAFLPVFLLRILTPPCFMMKLGRLYGCKEGGIRGWN